MNCPDCGTIQTSHLSLSCSSCGIELPTAERTEPRRSSPLSSSQLKHLIYAKESTLLNIHVILSSLIWAGLIIGTMGAALIYVLSFALLHLLAQSALISWIKGNGTLLSANQYPELYNRYANCCHKLGFTQRNIPDAYILNGNGIINAFATRFLGRDFVVLYSNVIDTLHKEPDAINFYIGHELGHLHRKHLRWQSFLAVSTWLPLIGSAYSRAREYTCDAYGLVCCAKTENAVRGLAALSSGSHLWSTLNIDAYLQQTTRTSGFWMSFHELIADYPWLIKRAARINDVNYQALTRHPLAWLFSAFIPRIGGGGAAGLLIMIAMIGILAAVAIPAYQDYTVRSKMLTLPNIGLMAANKVSIYYSENDEIPEALADAGFNQPLPSSVKDMSIDSDTGIIRMTLQVAPLVDKSLLFVPKLDEQNQISWKCTSEDIDIKYLPASCK